MNYTPSQTQAIEKSENLIVSAAAGSGKTSVLTAKILKLIESGVALNEMLVVTFSNAAASEMKLRIFNKLQESDSRNCFLQLNQIERANICTLHSFCLKLCRENFASLNLSAKVSVISSEHAESMKQKCIDEVFSSYYLKNNPDFENLILSFGGLNDTAIKQFILNMHEIISTLEDKNELAAKSLLCGETVNYAHEILNKSAEDKLKTAKKLVYGCKKLCEISSKAYSKLDEIEEIISGYILSFNSSFESFSEQIKSYPRMFYKELSEDTADYIKYQLAKAKGYIAQASETEMLFEFDKKYTIQAENISKTAELIYEIYFEFEKIYSKEKHSLNYLDFSDIEHFALDLLKRGDTNTPDIKYLFVDECQDLNPLQDKLLTLLSKNAQIFMVGDIKQSIYGFRHALPRLFQNRIEDSSNFVVRMNENFRSSPVILDFINNLSGKLFNIHGSIDYNADEALVPTLKEYGSVSFILTSGDMDSEEENLLSVEREAICAAKKIRAILGGKLKLKNQQREILPGDIAILLREISSSGKIYKSVFKRFNIPLSVDATEDLRPEIRNFLNLLYILKNPRDIEFVAVLCSPVVSLDMSDLAKIKINSEKNSFYEKSLDYLSKYSDELSGKLSHLFAFLDDLKKNEQILPFCEFLLYAYDRSSQNITSRRYLQTFLESSLELPEYALESLAAYLSAIDEMKKNSTIRNLCKMPSDNGCVNLMTIHKSKGLEFEIVFLCGLAKRFNRNELKDSLIVSQDFGVVCSETYPEKFIRNKSILLAAAAEKIKQENFAEELRLLYVALTRAKSHLFMCGEIGKIKTAIFRFLTPVCHENIYNANCFLDIIMPEVLKLPVSGNILNYLPDFYKTPLGLGNEIDIDIIGDSGADFEETPVSDAQVTSNEIIKYTPPEPIPSKVSVTSLISKDKPSYFGSGGLSSDLAISRGTKLHSILCQTDFSSSGSQFDKYDISVEDKLSLHAFFSSGLADRIRKSQKIFTEQPFCFLHNGCLVQGIIDLCFLENDRFILVDYKTDTIKPSEAKEQAKNYTQQLDLYSLALEHITKIDVSEKVIYFITPQIEVIL